MRIFQFTFIDTYLKYRRVVVFNFIGKKTISSSKDELTQDTSSVHIAINTILFPDINIIIVFHVYQRKFN